MKITIISALLILFIPIICIFIYILNMMGKNEQFPNINLERFKNKENENNINEMEQLINKSIKGVNGWILLSATFLAIYYLFNIWSISFSILNLFISAYYNEININISNLRILIFFFSLLSLIFTVLDNWINSKEKSNNFHNNWFETSIIVKSFIIEVQSLHEYDELCVKSKEFINELHNKIKDTTFL